MAEIIKDTVEGAGAYLVMKRVVNKAVQKAIAPLKASAERTELQAARTEASVLRAQLANQTETAVARKSIRGFAEGTPQAAEKTVVEAAEKPGLWTRAVNGVKSLFVRGGASATEDAAVTTAEDAAVTTAEGAAAEGGGALLGLVALPAAIAAGVGVGFDVTAEGIAYGLGNRDKDNFWNPENHGVYSANTVKHILPGGKKVEAAETQPKTDEEWEERKRQQYLNPPNSDAWKDQSWLDDQAKDDHYFGGIREAHWAVSKGFQNSQELHIVQQAVDALRKNEPGMKDLTVDSYLELAQKNKNLVGGHAVATALMSTQADAAPDGATPSHSGGGSGGGARVHHDYSLASKDNFGADGPEALSALQAMLGKPGASEGDTINALEDSLHAKGLYNGPMNDSQMGSGLRGALRAWANDSSISPGGGAFDAATSTAILAAVRKQTAAASAPAAGVYSGQSNPPPDNTIVVDNVPTDDTTPIIQDSGRHMGQAGGGALLAAAGAPPAAQPQASAETQAAVPEKPHHGHFGFLKRGFEKVGDAVGPALGALWYGNTGPHIGPYQPYTTIVSVPLGHRSQGAYANNGGNGHVPVNNGQGNSAAVDNSSITISTSGPAGDVSDVVYANGQPVSNGVNRSAYRKEMPASPPPQNASPFFSKEHMSKDQAAAYKDGQGQGYKAGNTEAGHGADVNREYQDWLKQHPDPAVQIAYKAGFWDQYKHTPGGAAHNEVVADVRRVHEEQFGSEEYHNNKLDKPNYTPGW